MSWPTPQTRVRNPRAGIRRGPRRRRYAEAEELHKRALVIREKALGPDHPEVARSINDLARLYRDWGRYDQALPLVQTAIATGKASLPVALRVLFGASGESLIAVNDALDDGLNVIQRASQTAAAGAVAKLAVRLAADTDSLAEMVRQDQDLAAEAERLDKMILAAVSEEPSKRDIATEQNIRGRLSAIAGRRDALAKILANEFPDYAALSNPQPLNARDIQALIADDEALVVIRCGSNERLAQVHARTARWGRVSAEALRRSSAGCAAGEALEVRRF
jgi:hypothetical protein